MVATIVLLPLILTITLPTDIKDVTISLGKVEVVKNATADNPRMVHLNLIFDVHNPTDKSLTTSKIEYQLFANGQPLGEGLLSYEDVPVNGRPQLLRIPTLNCSLNLLLHHPMLIREMHQTNYKSVHRKKNNMESGRAD